MIYPVARGTGPMLSAIGAALVLAEVLTRQGLAGLALVVLGIGLIATQGDLSAFRRPGGQAGVRWGMATGGLIASYTVVDAYAVKTLGITPSCSTGSPIFFASFCSPRSSAHARGGRSPQCAAIGGSRPVSGCSRRSPTHENEVGITPLQSVSAAATFHSPLDHVSNGKEKWWAWQGLNLRPLRCQHSALPLSYTPTRGRM